jgi:hypothetical protein
LAARLGRLWRTGAVGQRWFRLASSAAWVAAPGGWPFWCMGFLTALARAKMLVGDGGGVFSWCKGCCLPTHVAAEGQRRSADAWAGWDGSDAAGSGREEAAFGRVGASACANGGVSELWDVMELCDRKLLIYQWVIWKSRNKYRRECSCRWTLPSLLWVDLGHSMTGWTLVVGGLAA